MNNAELYSECSSFQQADSGVIFGDFLNLVKCDHCQFKSILDIGCGPGDTLVTQIVNKLNKSLTRVVGLDTSKRMIDFAIKKYQSELIRFYVFDIQNEFSGPYEFFEPGSFDLVTSFYCFNWVRKER